MHDRIVVVKIGGSILTNAKSYINIALRLKEKFIDNNIKLVLVVSAMKGITDRLIELYEGLGDKLNNTVDKHIEVAYNVGGKRLVEKINEELGKLKAILRNAPRDDPIVKDIVLSFGEKLSKIIMIEALENSGARVVGVDAVELIKARGPHGNAVIDYRRTLCTLNTILPKILWEADVAVVEGFIASNRQGYITTLGRGGSDYTATTIAALMRIDKVYLFTDVAGIMTGNPNYIKNVRTVPYMNYREALEASIYGVKRFHPRTFEPLIRFYPSTVYVGLINGKGTIIRDHNSYIDYKLKLVALKHHGSLEYVSIALIGECKHRHEAISKLVDYLEATQLEYNGLYVPYNRPTIIFLFNKSLAVKALNKLHELVLRGGEI